LVHHRGLNKRLDPGITYSKHDHWLIKLFKTDFHLYHKLTTKATRWKIHFSHLCNSPHVWLVLCPIRPIVAYEPANYNSSQTLTRTESISPTMTQRTQFATREPLERAASWKKINFLSFFQIDCVGTIKCGGVRNSWNTYSNISSAVKNGAVYFITGKIGETKLRETFKPARHRPSPVVVVFGGALVENCTECPTIRASLSVLCRAHDYHQSWLSII
jgi:hypothetical protein